jgi:periplasmic divalent cation tolerance protein
MIIIKTTLPNEGIVRKVIKHLIKQKLISSANFFPMKSVSTWTGNMNEVSEFIVFLKTRNTFWDKVRNELKKIHPYDIPCIIKIEGECNKEYDDWVTEKTK